MRALALVVALNGLAFAQSGKLAPELQCVDPVSEADVIIQYRHTPTPSHHQKIAERGESLQRELNLVKGAHYRVSAKMLRDLSPDPEVLYISPNRKVQGAADVAEQGINANIAFNYGWTGSGVAVAVIDSGISNDPDLNGSKGGSRVLYSRDFVGGRTDDHYGHGQHVAGIIAGSGASLDGPQAFLTFRGVAPAANLVNLRVLDQNGGGTDSNVIASIQTAISLKARYNIRVINLSLGRAVFETYTMDPLCQAVEQAWKAGIVIVVAAGNQGRNNSLGTTGYGTIQSPGNDPFVITVGAMKTMGTPSRTDDLIASYSSKGPTPLDYVVKPDLVAPGNRVISILASTAQLENKYPDNAVSLQAYGHTGSTSRSNQYYTMSGTSMAAPMVSGAAALLIQQNPNITPDQIKARLMKTATKTFRQAARTTARRH